MPKLGMSLEYLIMIVVLGLVALLTIATFGGFIDVGRGTSEQASHTYWRNADIGIIDWNLCGENATLVVKNNQRYDIRLNLIELNDGAFNITFGGTLGPEKFAVVSDRMAPGLSEHDKPRFFTVKMHYDNLDDGINGKIFVGAVELAGTC